MPLSASPITSSTKRNNIHGKNDKTNNKKELTISHQGETRIRAVDNNSPETISAVKKETENNIDRSQRAQLHISF